MLALRSESTWLFELSPSELKWPGSLLTSKKACGRGGLCRRVRVGELGSEKNGPNVISEGPASVHLGSIGARRTILNQGNLERGNTVNRLEAKAVEL